MEAGFIAIVAVVATIGIVCGVFIERFRKKPDNTQGTIYIYCDKSESKPSLLLDYDVPINDMASRKRVVFNVVVIK